VEQGIGLAARHRDAERPEGRRVFELERVVSCRRADPWWRTKLDFGSGESFDEIRAFSDKLIVAAVRVVEITSIAEENPSLFVAPTNSEFWAQCDDMQEAELVGRVQPQYPLTSRTKREEGMVMFYAVIEVDGSLSHLTLIQRLTPTLDSASADAVRLWHYKPPACGSTPIREETAISVYFSLRYN
jgi:hypothetical protein